MRGGRVARRREPHRPREATKAALDEMEGRVPSSTSRCLFSGDEEGVALDDDADGVGIDAWQIAADEKCDVGLVDVDRRRAFAGEVGTRRRALQISKHFPGLVGQFCAVGVEAHQVNLGSHGA